MVKRISFSRNLFVWLSACTSYKYPEPHVVTEKCHLFLRAKSIFIVLFFFCCSSIVPTSTTSIYIAYYMKYASSAVPEEYIYTQHTRRDILFSLYLLIFHHNTNISNIAFYYEHKYDVPSIFNRKKRNEKIRTQYHNLKSTLFNWILKSNIQTNDNDILGSFWKENGK